MRNILAGAAAFAVIGGVLRLSAIDPAMFSSTVVLTVTGIVCAAMAIIGLAGRSVE